MYNKRNIAVFLDRDGTINRDVNYCPSVKEFEILPGVPDAIRLLNQHGFKVIVITNQSGIARGLFTENTLSQIHEHMNKVLAQNKAYIDGIYYCPHHPDDSCDCRKPKPKLILQAAKEHNIALGFSYMIGDHPKDVAAGKNAGCKTIWLDNNSSNAANLGPVSAEYNASNLLDAVKWIISRP
jgi:D,D-heptose 1,7-bisphosphate phosphatase